MKEFFLVVAVTASISGPNTAHVDLVDGYHEDIRTMSRHDCLRIPQWIEQGLACFQAGLDCGLQFQGHLGVPIRSFSCEAKDTLDREDCIIGFDCKTIK